MEFEIQTLVDITNTRVMRWSQGTELEQNQQRNFTTLMQCIELRSNISYDRAPTVSTVDAKSAGFGSAYKSKHRMWTFCFSTDRESVYTDDQNNPVGLLEQDIQGVPIIKNLTETINIDIAVFDCYDPVQKNTTIKIKI